MVCDYFSDVVVGDDEDDDDDDGSNAVDWADLRVRLPRRRWAADDDRVAWATCFGFGVTMLVAFLVAKMKCETRINGGKWIYWIY